VNATIRPGAPTGVACGFAGIGACLVLVLANTGAGWLLVVLALTAGLLVAGFTLAWRAARTIDVALRVPGDAVAGRPVVVGADVSAAAPFELSVPELGLSWTGVPAPGRGDFEVMPLRRGVVRSCTIEVRCAAPLGLWWWRRRSRLQLTAPLHVAPLPVDVRAPWPDGGGAAQATLATGARGDELVRAVRDYVPGDPPKLVHWHASARTGTLVVRELESPTTPAVCVVCDLDGPPGRVEAVASVAAGLAAAALAEGTEVVLATTEMEGPVLAPVATRIEVGRRLARAVPGPPVAPPAGMRTAHAAAFVATGLTP